jgi:exonuclease SbcC
VIAVHDRTLFEYLALELSPTSRADRLITVDLNRSQGRPTTAEPAYIEWEPDVAVVAS